MLPIPRLITVALVCLMASGWTGDPRAQTSQVTDPIARELKALQAELAGTSRSDALWTSITPGVTTALELAERALNAGRRWTALERLAAARGNLVAAQYVAAAPPEARKDIPGFEAEWARQGTVLGEANRVPAGDALRSVQPAAARALAEASAFQVKVHYDASVIYGRATDADSGLFYLGSARAQQQFVTFAKALPPSVTAPPPAIRELSRETDALETVLLGMYRPPVSIDRHPEFIAASSALKEARELDGAGLRYGALQRYLLAALRVSLMQQSTAPDAAAIRAKLRSAEPSLLAPGVDHTIGRIYLERALTELDRPEPTAQGLAIAAAVADDVIPKYLAALGPAAPRPTTDAAPRVTVTLVRWPFT